MNGSSYNRNHYTTFSKPVDQPSTAFPPNPKLESQCTGGCVGSILGFMLIGAIGGIITIFNVGFWGGLLVAFMSGLLGAVLGAGLGFVFGTYMHYQEEKAKKSKPFLSS